MTEEDFLQIESSQRQHDQIMLHQVKISSAVMEEEYTLFNILKPKVLIDGNQYCVLHGVDLQSGICGFGETIHKAIIDFNNSFNKPLLNKIKRKGESQE